MADRLLAAKQGAYTDALSPRDVNAQLPNRVALSTKPKAAVASKAPPKEKEPPLQPPLQVYEPPSTDRKDGAIYQVGKMLGKGGFAVCYEGQLPGHRKKYALKIVRSKMPSKMEQKVLLHRPDSVGTTLTAILVSNGATNPLEDEASEHCPVLKGLLVRQLHLPCARTVSEWLSHGYGQAQERSNRTRGAILFNPNCRRYQIHARQRYHSPRPENG